jgi:uncharacterized SAM-binding protein YcdF (DUF218 family)
MVFFLSKFLPTLFFPMACLFIAVSLIAQVRKRMRVAIAANLAALAILCLMGNRAVSHLLVHPLETRDIYPRDLVGGVTGPAVPPQPTIHLASGADRLTYGAELYRAHKAPLVVLSGGGMPWNKGLPPESAQMSEIMHMLGVPRSAIVEESASRNCHENAAYNEPPSSRAQPPQGSVGHLRRDHAACACRFPSRRDRRNRCSH